MKVNKKTIIIFMLSIIFLLSMTTVVSATTADNNNTQELTQTHNTDITSTDMTNEYTIKSINKIQKEETNIKTATNNSYTTTVTNSQELKDAIENAKTTKYNNYTINYQKGEYDPDYVLDVYNLRWGDSKGTKTLILNGNGITFVGKDTNHFLTVDSGYNFILKNVTLSHFYNYGDGGAITCDGNLTVYDSTFDNNKVYFNGYRFSTTGSSGGAISGTNITIHNSLFKNNNALSGGAIYSTDCINIFNSEFVENKVVYKGGAVFTSSLFISNSSFTDNHLFNSTPPINRERYMYGGAVYANELINISDSIFIGNYIPVTNDYNEQYSRDYLYGGAIYGESNIIISNSTLRNNKLYYYSSGYYYYPKYGYGGAIYSLGNVSIYDSEFEKNEAYDEGGAIYAKNIAINNSNFIKNNYLYNSGSIIFSTENMMISSSKLENNHCRLNTIYANNTWSSITVKNCEFNNNSEYAINVPYITIYNSHFNNNGINGPSQVSVYNSTFNTNITLTTNKEKPHIGDNITLTISLRNQEEDVLNHRNLTVKIASETYSLITDDDGEATLDYIVNSTGNVKIIISYDGDYRTSTLETYITIPNEYSKISLNDVSDKFYSDNVKIQGKLTTTNNKAIPNQDIKIIINNKEEYNSKTDENGAYTLTISALTMGSNKVKAIFEGNELYNSANTATTFKVIKKNTKITLDTASNTTYNSIFIVTGKLTDSDNRVLKNQNVTIKINKEEFITRTNKNGIYSYNYTPKTLGINNITVSFENDNYNLSSITKTFKVNKKDTLLTLEPIKDNSYGDQVILSGKLTDIDGNIIPQATITIKYNSKKSQVLSDNKGEFNLELSDIIIGQNNVNVTFSGNKYYNPTSQNVTFNTKKRATIVSIDPIVNHKIGDQIDITGYLKDDNDKGLSYKILSIIINEDTYNVITENDGGFILEYMTEHVGINSILVTFGGNNYYEDTSSSATFIVDSKNTSLTINKINDTYLGNTIIISGYLIDEDNNIITDEKVYININDIEYDVKTDNSGTYSMKYTPSIIGTNYVSVEFKGNEYYEATTTSTTFNVNKIATNIIIDDIKYSDKVTINGKLNTQNNVPLEGAAITIQVNNKAYTVKTDSKGEFTLTVPEKSYGINNVTVTYKGNNQYSKSTNKTTFTVKQPTMIKYANIANVKIGTTVKIVGRLLSNVTGQAIKYAQVTVKVNDETYQLKTDGAGYVRLNYTVEDYNDQKIIFKYNGNRLNLASSNSTTFKVKQPTWIKTASISNTQYGSTVKIIGRLLNGTTAVKYAPVNVTVNGKVYNVKTDGAGYIRVNHTVNSYDVQKVTFKFAGDNLYLASSNSTSFKVKQPTSIKIANMANVKYGSTVKLVGRLLYNGTNAVKYTQVNVTVNGKTYKVKTDGAGYIRLNYTVNNYDDQKVTFKFAGNSLYLASSNSTIFKVKQPTWIKHASIGKVKQGNTVTIIGRVLYNGTNSVKYVPVNVTVNGKIYKLKTDGAGYFRLNYTATTLGTISFISNFAGNKLYLASTNSTKFTVVKS